jgi:hypothetical protein
MLGRQCVVEEQMFMLMLTMPEDKVGKIERQRIMDAVAEIDELISNEETLNLSEFQFLPPNSEPIAALAKPEKDSMQCTFDVEGKECGFI